MADSLVALQDAAMHLVLGGVSVTGTTEQSELRGVLPVDVEVACKPLDATLASSRLSVSSRVGYVHGSVQMPLNVRLVRQLRRAKSGILTAKDRLRVIMIRDDVANWIHVSPRLDCI